jgi:hypothetical protein
LRSNRLLISMSSAILFFVTTPSSLPAFGQDQSAPGVAALPSDSDLDALLAARNWNGLAAALGRPAIGETFGRKLNWLKARTLDGTGGFLVAFFYSGDLWAAGNSLKIDDPAKDLRAVAGLFALYSYELISIDGAKCEDVSAPSNRATQLFTKRPTTFAFLKNLPSEVKLKVIDLAIAMERKTAPMRKDDDLLCRDGLDQMKAGLERGAQQEVPTQPGHIGKTIAVTAPPDWVPKFVSPAVYGPMQDKARSEMREKLLKIVE